MKIPFAFLLISFLSSASTSLSREPDAALRVALYPYVPDMGAFETALTNQWTAAGHTETIEFVSWDCYNDAFPTNADVVVFEGSFLETYAADFFAEPDPQRNGMVRHKPLLAPLFADGKEEADFLVSEKNSFLPFALAGGVANGRLRAIPQMVCTYYAFLRPETAGSDVYPMPSQFPLLAPRKSKGVRPDHDDGVLFYAAGDDMTLGIVRIFLEQTLVSPTAVTNAFAGLVRATGAEQLAHWPTNGDSFVRADWFREGDGHLYIDYSEALSRLGGAAALARGPKDQGRFACMALQPERTPYFVDYVSVTGFCPEKNLPAARELARLMAGREFVSAALWPDGGAPQYVLPARLDVFREFASRDDAYEGFFRDAQRPGNRAFRLPPNAPAIIQEAAERTKPLLAQ